MRSTLFLFTLAFLPGLVLGQGTRIEQIPEKTPKDVFSTSSCMGCHGQTGMGGMGGPIAKTPLPFDKFLMTVRKGKGMMPATDSKTLPDSDVERIYEQLQDMAVDPDQVPLAFKVGALLQTKNVFKIFLAVFGISALLSMWTLGKWIRGTGMRALWPRVVKLGLIRSAGVVAKSLVLDGLLVQSLWKSSKHRWFMHGLMLYGFLGLILADVLMTIYNPGRGDLPLLDPLKLLPILSGGMLLFGVFYVMYRYKRDPFIDNGVTLGGDFLFVQLLFHTTVSGFLTVAINRLGMNAWVMPIYMYHLGALSLLILTAPFSRFQHMWVVPILASITRLTEAVSASEVDLGFQREPSPGRHHKSEQIAASVMHSLGSEYEDEEFRIRYYP